MQATALTLDAGVDVPIDHQAVRAHLAHIVSSSQFAGAPKLAKFLTFVVETVLAGCGHEIKESLIAIEVYARRADYNPQIDSTVRVEAGRLRTRLGQYYADAGAGQPMEIVLPKGKYVPIFRTRDANMVPEAPQPAPIVLRPEPIWARYRFAFAALLALSAGTVIAYGYFSIVRGGPVHALAASAADAAIAADPRTMKLYLRAHELLRIPVLKDGVVSAVPPTALEAARLFAEVTRLAPKYARGWVGLAEANEWLYELDRSRPPERLIAAKASARRAIEIDPNLSEGWAILTSVLFFRDWNIPEAERACRRAIELNPRDTLVQQRLVDLLRLQGRHDEAARELARAASLQPSAPNLRNRKALLLLDAGNLNEAMEEASKAEALNPSKQQGAYTSSLWIQAAAHQRQGSTQKAEALYRKALQAQPHDLWSEPSLGHLLAVTGRIPEALVILDELNRQIALGRPQHKAVALVSLGLGRKEDAIGWLERGFIERDCAVLFTALDARFAPLRSEPRFQDLLARIRRTYSGNPS